MLVVIFSKDRGCQLELLLRSLKQFFTEWRQCAVEVLFTASTPEFAAGYEKVKAIHPDFIYTEERSFKKDLKSIIAENSSHGYVVFLVDDLVFKRPFSITAEECDRFEKDPAILCLSLRLGRHITRCYTRGDIETPPPEFLDERICIWKWEGAHGDWGYPMSLDGHIYRLNLINLYADKLPYLNPNTFEAAMSVNTPKQTDHMICFSESVIVNNPLNRVQNAIDNLHGTVTAEALNERFLAGNRLGLAPFIGLQNRSAHQEVPVVYLNKAE